jgi:hypothetical protein
MSYSQSPLVRLSLDKEEKNLIRGNNDVHSISVPDEDLTNQVKLINLNKKIITKQVEVTTKIVYTFEDGSTKEIIEKQNHIFDFTNNV